MSEQSDLIAEAVKRHVDLILKASGSGLRHYTMTKTRDAILSAGLDFYEEAALARMVELNRDHLEARGRSESRHHEQQMLSLEILREALRSQSGAAFAEKHLTKKGTNHG